MEPNLFENYVKETRIINLVSANIFSLFLFIPITILYGIPFYLIWKHLDFINIFKEIILEYEIYLSVFLILIILAGIVLHELIHGLTFAIFSKQGFKSIKFGILLKMLTPYCHCKEPLKVNHYIIGAIMPALLLGLLPAIVAVITGNIFLLAFAIFFTGVAAGDFLIIKLIWKEDQDSMVLDHPSEAGCFIFKKV